MGLLSLGGRTRGKKTSAVSSASMVDEVRPSSAVASPPSLSALSADSSEKIVSTYEPRLTPMSSPPSRPHRESSSSISTTPLALIGQDCSICHRPCARRQTRTSNRNGNAGRWYYKCDPCDKFIRFDDSRGIDQGDQGNPLCDCGQSSRRQASGRDKGRKIFYTCTLGACDFFEWHRNDDGSVWAISDDVADALKKLRMI